MTPTTKNRAWQCLALTCLALALAGCSEKIKGSLIPNTLPEIRLTAAPVDTTGRYFYSYTLNWVSFDPDGRVDYYLYAVDPPKKPTATDDTVWTQTRDHEVRLTFSASQPDPENRSRYGRDFHTFVIKAVDNRGGAGPFVSRSFYSRTEAPQVTIQSPQPSSLAPAFVTPSVRISWSGDDPDGVFTRRPEKYKYIMLGPSSLFSPEAAYADPDSFRMFYEPDFEGWTTVRGDTTTAQFTTLIPDAVYLFAIIAIDEAGYYSPDFTTTTNVLQLKVGYAGANGPKLTLFNEFFNYTYASGGYSTLPVREIQLEIPANQRVTINWSALPPEGAQILYYRWSLNNPNVHDNRARMDEARDTERWSEASAGVTAATVGPFEGGELAKFYVDVEDNTNLKSLGIVSFTAVQSSLEKPLLIVDDTRLKGDRRVGTCVTGPSGPWPTSAELDTFLYARGNVPWRCAPTGWPNAPPGIFAGYDFDTLGTRNGRRDVTVRLSAFGDYAHVIWIVDRTSAGYNQPGTDGTAPQTALRFMTSANQVNTLATYIKQGGQVWLTGGGGALASMIAWNRDAGNDSQFGFVWSIRSSRGEVGPGRFMYDVPKWQSQIASRLKTTAFLRRFVGRFDRKPTTPFPPDGIWDGIADTLRLEYNNLPAALDLKTAATDPLSPHYPFRTGTDIHQTGFSFEHLEIEPNIIVEDVDPNPLDDVVREESTLDTLYRVYANSIPGSNVQPNQFRRWVNTPIYPAMTYYHGTSSPPFVFNGFDLWSFRRSQSVEIVDFVLRDLWGLTRTPVPMLRAAHAAAKPQNGAATVPKGKRTLRPWLLRPGPASQVTD